MLITRRGGVFKTVESSNPRKPSFQIPGRTYEQADKWRKVGERDEHARQKTKNPTKTHYTMMGFLFAYMQMRGKANHFTKLILQNQIFTLFSSSN